MTQTPQRDWQKDSDLCRHGAMVPVSMNQTGELVQALDYWLQEAGKRAVEIAKLQTLLDEAHKQSQVWIDTALKHGDETIEEYKRAKAAEAREQRLKEAIIRVTQTDEEPFPADYLENILSTLYPDTPAPKEGE